ncbi:short chain dehydrogenase [Pseudoclavibacter sp. CFCC 11306]|nr:short chain dehydrogenase [Pseudoclavibacter sp. CFCC 11306]
MPLTAPSVNHGGCGPNCEQNYESGCEQGVSVKRVVVFGGHGHVGRAAVEALQSDHEVIVVGRRTDPGADARDPQSVTALFGRLSRVDAVVVALGDVPFKPVVELTGDDYQQAFAGKVLPQASIVRAAVEHLADGGSITLTTGILARQAIAAGAAAAMANGALESFVIAAAPEMPRGIRLNAVSPTVLESAPEYFDSFPGFVPVSDATVGQAFKKSVDGVQTGQIYRID